jgi:hypothetical protein
MAAFHPLLAIRDAKLTGFASINKQPKTGGLAMHRSDALGAS